MDESVGSTIEKIKLQEQDMEARLKEKREYEAALASLNRAIKDATTHIEKSEQEQLELKNKIQKLRPRLEIEKLRRDALISQLKVFTDMLEDLRAQTDRGITNVWNIRSSLCETVQNVSDECDIWALLMKPVLTEPLEHVTNNNESDRNLASIDSNRLQQALERREKALAERERLLSEPETGEEFIRIKNALHYSLEKTANLKKVNVIEKNPHL